MASVVEWVQEMRVERGESGWNRRGAVVKRRHGFVTSHVVERRKIMFWSLKRDCEMIGWIEVGEKCRRNQRVVVVVKCVAGANFVSGWGRAIFVRVYRIIWAWIGKCR